MTEIEQNPPKSKEYYRKMVSQMGKKEFTLKKMLEYGFWPKNMPTPFERQENETPAIFAERERLFKEYEDLINQISKSYTDINEINRMLCELSRKFENTYDIETIKKMVAKQIMKESIERRAERKKQRKLEKQQRASAWKKKKEEDIIFIGKGYSSMIHKKDVNKSKLELNGLPIINNATELANFLGIEFKQLRFLAYHRDVITMDHYVRYEIPKKSGKTRRIAAPMPLLKRTQRAILDNILNIVSISEKAHGFLNGKSVKTNATEHDLKPNLLINMDIENFFPTVTLERIRGMFLSFGYSGQVASILAMICTYCERSEIVIKDEKKYVASSKRILPQGSPASPMITNVICRKLDSRLSGLAKKFGFSYSRYADDLSFSLQDENDVNIGKFSGLIYKIVEEEGFKINKAKTRYLKHNNRQEITGVVINEKLGVSKKWLKRFRAALYNAKQLLKKDDLGIEKIHELSGMAAWLKSINPERYEKILNEYDMIIHPEKEVEVDKIQKKKKITKYDEFALKCLKSKKRMKHFQTDLEGNLRFICNDCKNDHKVLITLKGDDYKVSCLVCDSPMKEQKTLSPNLLNFNCVNQKCSQYGNIIQIKKNR